MRQSGLVHVGEAPREVHLVVALLDALEDVAVLLVASAERGLGLAAVGDVVHDRVEQALAPELDRTRVHLHVALLARGQTVPEREEGAALRLGLGHGRAELVRRQGVDVADAQAAQPIPVEPVEGAGRGVRIHDGARSRGR